jgi:hypothetical protein
MKTLPLTPEICAIAQRVIWFEAPNQALAITPRFLAYGMTYGNHADIEIVRQHRLDDEQREALDQAPPGIFDPRSWAYWNLKLGRYPTPPMPERLLPERAASD